MERFELLLNRSRKLAAAFTSTSNFSLASADVARPRQTIARNMRPSYQTQWDDAKYCYPIITARWLAVRSLRSLSDRLRIRPFDLAHRQHLDLRLPLVHLDYTRDADHFSLKSDGPPVTCQFRPSRDVAGEGLIRVFCAEIKESISLFLV